MKFIFSVILLTLTFNSFAGSFRSPDLFHLLQELKKTTTKNLKYTKCNSQESIEDCIDEGAYKLYPGYKMLSTCSGYEDLFVDKDILYVTRNQDRENNMYPNIRFPMEAARRLISFSITQRAKDMILDNSSFEHSNYMVDMYEDLEDRSWLDCTYGEVSFDGTVVWDKSYGEGLILTFTHRKGKGLFPIN